MVATTNRGQILAMSCEDKLSTRKSSSNQVRVLQIVAAPVASVDGHIGINGPERRAANVICQWRSQGVVPVIAYPRRGRMWEKFKVSSEETFDWEIGSKWALHRAFQLAAQIRRREIHVVHTQGPASLDLIAGLAAKLARVPFVVTRPVMIEDMTTYPAWRLRLYRAVDRIGLSLATVVVAISEQGLRRLVASNLALGRKLQLVRNGVALDRFLAVARARRLQESFVVGMTAQLTAQKAWPDFLAVINELHRRGIPARGLVVGGGPLQTELQAMARAMGLCEVVEFTGYQEDVAPALARMDIFLFTSSWEGLSVAVIEAMASGLPVVATDVAAIREQVEEGQNGAVRAFGDIKSLTEACEALWRAPAERRRQGENSAARAARLFSEDRMVAEYAEIYRSLS